jgi:acetyl-CoA C-acetyltransferase
MEAAMALDLSRTPVVIGGGVHTNRISDISRAPDTLDLLEIVAREAAADAGADDLLRRLTNIWTINSLSFGGADPTAAVRQKLGVGASTEVRYSTVGGSVPQVLVNRAAQLVLSGARPMVLIAGAESLATQKRIAKTGVLEGRVKLPPLEERPNLWPPMDLAPSTHPVETQHGMSLPAIVYPLIETAVAHAEGHDPQSHRRYMANLMDRLNAVAATNPESWFPTRRTADELASISDENRWISFPYTKHLCSVMDVDMAAGFLVTDAQTAREAGLAPTEVAYFHGGAEGRDIWIVSERPSLADSPGIAECARRALGMAKIGLEDVTAFDLYSAFPSSVQLAMRAIGLTIDDTRPFTLTGGLPYHGGPGNNYVSHSIVGAFRRAREGANETVLIEGSGYSITKHAVGIYSSSQPADLFDPDFSVQSLVDAKAAPVPVNEKASGPAEVVAYTVPFDRSGEPQAAIVLASLDDERNVGLAEPILTKELLEVDGVGLSVRVAVSDEGNTVLAS